MEAARLNRFGIDLTLVIDLYTYGDVGDILKRRPLAGCSSDGFNDARGIHRLESRRWLL
jgi:hypothetical protein